MYWNTVVREVENRENPQFPFMFTTVGDPTLEIVREEEERARRAEQNSQMYYFDPPYQSVHFTRREAQCMVHFLQGKTVVDTAKELRLSPRTVEYYVKNMRQKMQCKTKQDLVNTVRRTAFVQEADRFRVEAPRSVEEG